MAKKLILGTEDTDVLAPYEYPFFKEMLDNMHANHWRPQEIGTGLDKFDLETKLTSRERELFMNQFSFLTFMDVNILDPLAMMKLISTAPEVSAWIARQIAEEENHSASYQYIAEQTGMDQRELYTLHQRVPTMIRKTEIAAKYAGYIKSFLLKVIKGDFITNSSIKELLKGITGYALGYEGMWFTGGFASIFALTERSLMKGTAKQLQFIWRDELNHVSSWVEWIKGVQKETGVYLTQFELETILEEFLEAEHEYAEECLPSIIGYSPDIHYRWMKFLANVRLGMFGFSKKFEDAEEPAFIGKYQMKNEGNFFETRVTEYRSGGVLDGTWE